MTDDTNGDEQTTDLGIDHIRGGTKTITYTGERPPTAVDEWDEVSAADAVHSIIPTELPNVDVVSAFKYHGDGFHVRFKLGVCDLPAPMDPRSTFVLDTRRGTAPDLEMVEHEIESNADDGGDES